MKERAFKFRWTSLLFYIALCMIIAAGLIAILALQKPVKEWLADFENTYETYKPKNQIQRIFDEYFAEPDVEELIALAEEKPEYNAPDTYEDAVERYAAKLRGKTMTYGYLAGTDQKVINVKADGALVARFFVREKEEKNKYDQPIYELDKIILFYEKPLDSINIMLPERYRAYADGVEISDEYVTASGIKDDERDSVPEGAFLFTYKVCSMTGLYQTPKIKVTDDKGNEVQLDYDEEKNLFSCKYEYSEELKEQYSEFVIEAMTKYATWMQNDYDSDFYRIKPYFDQNTQLYEDIRLNPRLFVWEHDGYKFENVETSEFFDYGGVISCRVKFDHILTKRGKENYVDKNDHTVYLREVDGEYKIFYMVSH
jgi:hypothetical protein